jgi:hypothetical protein
VSTFEQALADTKCATTSAVRAANNLLSIAKQIQKADQEGNIPREQRRVRWILTSTILLLQALEPTIPQAGPAMAQQPPPPAPSPTPTSEEVWPTNGWPTATPAEMGMDETKLKQARDFAVSKGGGSGVVTRGGKLVMS